MCSFVLSLKYFSSARHNVDNICVIVFTRISAAVRIKFSTPQIRRLFEGGVYLKVGRDKELL